MKKAIPRIGDVDTRTSHSVNLIIGLIRNGHLKSGDQLPPQDELARKLGISRTSLREALAELSYRGVVISVHGRGTFVSEQEVHAENMMESRRILEPKVARLAAERADSTEIADLESLCAVMERFVNNGDTVAFSDYDLKFHSRLASMTHNKALITLFNSIGDMLLHLQNIVQIIPGAMHRAHEFHLELAAAVQAKNGDLAETTMLRHIEDVANSLKKAKKTKA
jgi:Transcriptional regulators